MRKSIRYLLLAALFVPFLSCGEAPGTFSMSFSWEEEPGGELWVWIRVEEREDPSQSGRILGSSGPDSYIFGEPFSVQIEGVANGDNRVIVVEAREGTNSSLPVLYYGVSEPFSLVAGKHAQVDVPMSLQTSEAQLFAAQVKLLFGGEQAHDIAFAQVTQATIWTRSAGATGVVLANDESFSANLTNLSLEDEQLECETSMEEDVEWTVCQLHNWDLTGGLDSVSDGALSVFVKFIDRYGYESQVNKASVNLDMSGPLAVIASLSPAVARPSGTVSLSVTFHEALSEEVGANVLEVVPELPAGSEISAPERVGDSLTWLWSITIGPDAAEAGLAYTFEVQTEDELGNQEEEKQQLQDKSKEPLTLNIDSSPPLLANSDEIALAQTLFGPADVGTTIEFDMVFEEDNPRTVVNQEGECSGICPTVRLGIAELGKVSVVEGELGLTFHYQYTVDNADWSGGDKEVAINISWSDEAGNGTDVELVDRLRFDFQAPTALSCKLLPKSGNSDTVFTYSLTSSEPLSETPLLKVHSESPTLFSNPPEVSEDGYTYVWSQAAAGLPDQTIDISIRLVDLAGNVSEGASREDLEAGYICAEQGSLDGVPPQLVDFAVTTSPEIVDLNGQPLLACGPEGKLHVQLTVKEAQVMPEGYPLVQLGVPENPPEFVLDGEPEFDEAVGEWTLLYSLHPGSADPVVPEGLWPIKVTLMDLAGNQAQDALGGELVKVDFTPPDGKCTVFPQAAKLGDTISVTVSTSEPMLAGKPELESPVPFVEPDPDASATNFSYAFDVKEEDPGLNSWSYAITLVDLAGNENDSATGCTGTGIVDSTAPAILNGEISTVPWVALNGGIYVLIVKEGGKVKVEFDLVEAQGLAGPPEVHLNIPGAPVPFPGDEQGTCNESVPGTYSCNYSLLVDALSLAEAGLMLDSAEGYWTVKVVVEDTAGNMAVVDDLGGLVRLDFTPPQAECSLSPTPPMGGYPVGQKFTVVATPLEEYTEYFTYAPGALKVDFLEGLEPPIPEEFLEYENDTEFRYSAVVQEGDGEGGFEAWVGLTDLVGNSTDNSCTVGKLKAYVDGVSPTVDMEYSPYLSVYHEGDNLDLDVTPLRAGLTVDLSLTIVGEYGDPEVYFGQGAMSPKMGYPQGNGYWVFNRTLEGTEGLGEQHVTISLIDHAGNTTDYDLVDHSATLDFIDPVAQCMVNIPDAKAGDEVELVVTATEKLKALPELESGLNWTYDEAASTPDSQSPKYVFTHPVELGEDYAAWTVDVTGQDLAGNPALEEVLCSAQGTVDGKTIVVPGATAHARHEDPDAPGNMLNTGQWANAGSEIVIEFTPLEVPDTIQVKVGDTVVESYSKEDDEYIFVHPLNGAGEHGDVLPVTVEVEDEAGNNTFVGVGTIILDYVAPALSGGAYLERCDGYSHARVGESTNDLRVRKDMCSGDDLYLYQYNDVCNAGNQDLWVYHQVKVQFSTNEAIDVEQVEVEFWDPAGTTSLFLAKCFSHETLVTAYYTPTGDETENPNCAHSLVARLVDKAGNVAVVELGCLRFDFTAPEVPDVETEGRIVYHRNPWGSDATAGKPESLVFGDSGAVESKSRIIIYNGSDTADASPLGESVADDQGRIGGGLDGDGVGLESTDRPRVYMEVVDAAGNRADADPEQEGIQATLIRDVEWIATLDDKVAYDTKANPHVLQDTPWFKWHLVQGDSIEYGDVHGLGSAAAASVLTDGAHLDWTEYAHDDGVPSSSEALFYAGVHGGMVRLDGWVWDGREWTSHKLVDPEADGNPTPSKIGVTYDSRRERLWLFGGVVEEGVVGDVLWAWDGSSWEKAAPIDPEGDGNPSGRIDAIMAYDSGRDVVVLFGGMDIDGYLGDTWEWNGESWRLVAEESAETPVGRIKAGMAYDSVRGRTVMFGGRSEEAVSLGDTWEWDGNTWEKVAADDPTGVESPKARRDIGLAYDVGRGRTVLFGGRWGGNVGLSDLWEWDGSSWELQAQSDPEGDGNPAGGITQSFAYDVARDSIVTYSQGDDLLTTGRTIWEWDGTSWETRGPYVDYSGYGLPDERSEFNFFFDPDSGSSWLFFGGNDVVGNDVNCGRWGGFDWEILEPEDPYPEERSNAKMCYDPLLEGGSHLLFGGWDIFGQHLDELWRLTDGEWSALDMFDVDGSGSPPEAYRQHMYYNTSTAHAELLVDGDLWRLVEFSIFGFDGFDWEKVYAYKGDGTDPETAHHAAWDAERERLVAFEVYNTQDYHNAWRIWEWDGVSWSQTIPEDPEDDGGLDSADASYDRVAVVYDPTVGGIVTYARLMDDDLNLYLGRAWFWNGTSFILLQHADSTDDGDPALEEVGLAGDAQHGDLLFFGGGEYWIGAWGVQQRPGQVLSVDFSSAGHCAAPKFGEVSATWVGGGTGHSPAGDGADLYLWDENGWKLVGENNATADDPAAIEWSTTDSLQLQRIFVGDDQLLHFAFLPDSANSALDLAQVATDYVEVEVHYRIEADEGTYCEE